MDNLESTGGRIKALRRREGLTQKDLSILLQQERGIEVGVSFLSQIESGTKSPSIDLVGALADVLHTSVDYLLLRSADAAAPGESAIVVQVGTPGEARAIRSLLDEFMAVEPEDREMLADMVRLFARAISRRRVA